MEGVQINVFLQINVFVIIVDFIDLRCHIVIRDGSGKNLDAGSTPPIPNSRLPPVGAGGQTPSWRTTHGRILSRRLFP
jgi:hypothetical protein